MPGIDAAIPMSPSVRKRSIKPTVTIPALPIGLCAKRLHRSNRAALASISPLHHALNAINRRRCRICPHCRSKLPTQTDHVDSKILAVIGGTSSGKSHYIATMVQQLQSVLGPNMKIKVMGVGDTTRTNYRDYYYERVYRDKLVLDQTQSAQNNPVVRDPLIYRLEFPRQRLRIRAINLVLFDAAGEDIQDENTLGLYNKYILHAAGIIFLINPSRFSPSASSSASLRILEKSFSTHWSEWSSCTLRHMVSNLATRLKCLLPLSLASPTYLSPLSTNRVHFSKSCPTSGTMIYATLK